MVLEPDRRAFKQVVISDREVTNTNPVLDGITWNGEPWGEEQIVEIAHSDAGGKMVPEWTESTRETYDDDGIDTTESLLFSWFIDDDASELSKERSDDTVSRNTFKPGPLDGEAEQSGRLVTLWLVARDERGGVTWLTRQLRIIQGE